MSETIESIILPDGLQSLVGGYMEYVYEVIKDRAIVGIDGLKPSQRRILVTMKELEKVKGFTKCASVVGSCMKLHPHGDCLSGDTEICDAKGNFYTIAELFNSGRESIDILAYDTKKNEPVVATARAFRIGQFAEKIYNIELSNGTILKVTANHPFLTHSRTDTVNVNTAWVKAENLEVGSRLVSANVSFAYTMTNRLEAVCNNKLFVVKNGKTTIVNAQRGVTRDFYFACELYEKLAVRDEANFKEAIKKSNSVLSVDYAEKNYGSFDAFVDMYNNYFITVIDIKVDEVEKTPMYDFTVDNFENMFIPIACGGTGVTMVCVHNSAIYETLCRMTDVSETLNVPLIKGKGKFKKVYSDEPSAADRYTECDLMPITAEYFGDSDGINRVPNYDNSRTEPELLGVSFPSILCNPTQGIAVGIASNIPAFNFKDVLDATINVIKTGRVGMELIPDFTTGGEYVYNADELKKIIRKGSGKIKLRGKWRIDGKTITIDEIPYYTSIQRIMKAAEKIQGVVHCKDLSGLRGGKPVMQLDIECNNKNSVQYVLEHLLKDTELQMTITSNIAAIINGVPEVLGVENLLKHWVEFRKSVLTKKYTLHLEAVNNEIARYEVFVALLSDTALRDNFITALTKSETEAKRILVGAFPNADDSILNWILDMKIRALGSADKAMKKLNDNKAYKASIEKDLADIGAVIIRQLEELKVKYIYPRKTEVTNVDYEFKTAEVKVEAYDCMVCVKDKFITKEMLTHYTETKSGLKCKSTDTIILIDSQGKILRVLLENVQLTAPGTRGTYIPSFCNIPDDFDIVDYAVVEDISVGYIYSDGFASVLDFSEWVDMRRNTKVTPLGISPNAYLICGKYNPACEYIYVITNKQRFCFVPNDFKVKSRTARTRIVLPDTKEDEKIVACVGMNTCDAMRILPTYLGHTEKLGWLEDGEIFDAEALKEIAARKE